MTDIKVFAIVVTYKRKELLERVLFSLQRQTHALSKIIVVDNNSQDGTEELVESIRSRAEFGLVEYYNTMNNLGGAGGFEFGFKTALSGNSPFEYLWLMDDDLIPDSTCLEELLKTAKSTSSIDIIQPLRKNIDGSCAELSPVLYDLSKFWLVNPKRESVLQRMSRDDSLDTFKIAGIPFEGPLIPRELIIKIGNPNPKFFIFNDDLDYSLRAQKIGGEIFCNPKAVATRMLLNNQSNDLKSWKGYFMLRNHFYILRSYGKTFFVRNKPYGITFLLCLFYILKIDLRAAKICLDALTDSKKLSNNDIHKP